MIDNANAKLLKKDLRELSYYLGTNLDLVQGAGGNTSVKENGTLWVKASGYWLSDNKNDIFVPLDRQLVLNKISLDEEDLSSSQLFKDKYQNIRPSIETTLHALMPHKFVAHVHSANVISHAVLKNCKTILNDKLDNLNWLWVPYERPGLPLTKKLKSLNILDFDIIILANHGLVIGGDSKESLIEILKQVEKKLFRPMRKKPIDINRRKILELIGNLDFKLPKYEFCHALAMDDLAIQIIGQNALYPDHVIFLGPGNIPVFSYQDFKNIIANSTLNINEKVIVIKDLGVIVNKNLSENAEEMLYCLTNVLLKLQSKDKLQYLTHQDEAELLGWDAEKYRKLIER
tara:strand:+ start:312 stop:1346 length:1035 start_codon:yes stop_codon:yes gene_type:complete